MAIKGSVGGNGGGNYEKKIIPQGNHVARCYGMIEIGTVDEVIMGEKKQIHKILIDWELPNETAVFKEENGEQPFVYSKDFTLSMNEKANLRKMITAWTGKQMNDAEAEAFDVTSLIGQSCMLNIVHNKSKDGTKTYANLAGVTPLPKGFACPPQVNPSRLLEYENWNQEVFMGLPAWLSDKICTSKEYKLKFSMPSKDQVSAKLDIVAEEVLPF